MAKARADWQRQTYRVIYCDHSGAWITQYYVGDKFSQIVKHVQAQPEVWIIKEISERIDNGELVGKELIRLPELR